MMRSIPLSRPPLYRLRCRIEVLKLRWRIHWADREIDGLKQNLALAKAEVDWYPKQIESHQKHSTQLTQELMRALLK